jgi:hypothetical protein
MKTRGRGRGFWEEVRREREECRVGFSNGYFGLLTGDNLPIRFDEH